QALRQGPAAAYRQSRSGTFPVRRHRAEAGARRPRAASPASHRRRIVALSGTVALDDARGPAGVVLYAIGDVHGRLDLLTAMHARIAADRERRLAADWRIIHLGDFVDRGPDSKGVVDFLLEAT